MNKKNRAGKEACRYKPHRRTLSEDHRSGGLEFRQLAHRQVRETRVRTQAYTWSLTALAALPAETRYPAARAEACRLFSAALLQRTRVRQRSFGSSFFVLFFGCGRAFTYNSYYSNKGGCRLRNRRRTEHEARQTILFSTALMRCSSNYQAETRHRERLRSVHALEQHNSREPRGRLAPAPHVPAI
ncbi:hypothetical protein NDU88_004244 [Pleurodeles waltl]|uniref:Uncharacterized protein n=1 Tax=Pleurodeles waltl TaxID=8319 RepID=A0AAV7NIX5_PLEWA|nr:hypothetical protein NDU88_004244 [Pleurodeles waltl]